jgi:tetratricopeptide (TPR) repeat protein
VSESIVVEFDEDREITTYGEETSRLASSDPGWQQPDADSMQRLGLERGLFERARQVKTDLMNQGVIEGTARLPGLGPDLDELRAIVETEPDNADHRVALGNALFENDEREQAIESYRWIYRHAPDRAGDVLSNLLEIADGSGASEVPAHRLVGAMYRGAGDWQAAASHYEASLLASRGN